MAVASGGAVLALVGPTRFIDRTDGCGIIENMTSPQPRPQRQPHWLVVTVVGLVAGLAITWLGVNDWRVPWVRAEAAPTTGPQPESIGGSTEPVRIDLLADGGVDVGWEIVDDPELHGYALYFTAVRPIEYTYSVPRYSGDPDVTERLYPARYLDGLLVESDDPRRVQSDQVWHVCVQGMKETPLNTPIDDYIIPGTRACSQDFALHS
ncbi:MAG: hypothetical protein ACJA07_003162 [Rhodococcus sp. (in: high G+C Gram-positive bacteria)]